MSPFTLVAPDRGETPILVEVPHAGLVVPSDVEPAIVVPREVLLRDSDLFVDRLFDQSPSHGAALLVSAVSRYVIDLNRAPDDVDRETVPDHPAPRPTQARGVVWRTTTDGQPAARGPLSYAVLADRLARYHRPYHLALEEALERKRERFGYAILVAAHSMPSTARDGLARRADIVPGTRGRTTADPRVIDAVDRHFRSAGLSVRHDDPYRGGFSTARYGQPERGVHAIQIEINRALYANEANGTPKEEGLAWLRELCGTLLDRLARVTLPRVA